MPVRTMLRAVGVLSGRGEGAPARRWRATCCSSRPTRRELVALGVADTLARATRRAFFGWT